MYGATTAVSWPENQETSYQEYMDYSFNQVRPRAPSPVLSTPPLLSLCLFPLHHPPLPLSLGFRVWGSGGRRDDGGVVPRKTNQLPGIDGLLLQSGACLR